jgi:hypothetical protein
VFTFVTSARALGRPKPPRSTPVSVRHTPESLAIRAYLDQIDRKQQARG